MSPIDEKKQSTVRNNVLLMSSERTGHDDKKLSEEKANVNRRDLILMMFLHAE